MAAGEGRMNGHASTSALPRHAPSPLARWRCWLFNWLARREEASLARSLGLPVKRVILVDTSSDD
jgi:hypothetical protein